jgi:hypothetical protein
MASEARVRERRQERRPPFALDPHPPRTAARWSVLSECWFRLRIVVASILRAVEATRITPRSEPRLIPDRLNHTDLLDLFWSSKKNFFWLRRVKLPPKEGVRKLLALPREESGN